jgi:Universal stress protein UspA and related nucleotide-binding proteins
MKSILIPVDFSPFSITACKTGAYIAEKTGATLHLLHIAQAPEDWEKMAVAQQQKYPQIEGAIVDGEIKLDRFAQNPLFGSLDVATHIYGGVAYKQIVAFAEKYKMDLIIMGAHGVSESDGLFIGSTAQKVIRIAPCPVLSVKKQFKPVSLKKIVFASDFEEEGLKESFKAIKTFATGINAKIDYAYVNTPHKFVDSTTIEKRVKNFVSNQSKTKPNLFIHNDYSKEEGILNISKKVKANVLALVTHNRKGKSNYLLGVTETLLFHSDIPVLSQVM